MGQKGVPTNTACHTLFNLTNSALHPTQKGVVTLIQEQRCQ